MQPNVFQFKDYKKFILETIESKKAERGYQTKLAMSAGCQRSYLSQVLRGNQHLTLEHACGLIEFWNLSSLEADYFLDLISFCKAGTRALKNILKERLDKLKRQSEEIEGRLVKTKTLSEHDQQLYYSAWYWSAIHIAISVPELHSIEQISIYLGVPREVVSLVIKGLERMELIKSTEGFFETVPGNLHLPRDSPLVKLHHNNWRQKASMISESKSKNFQFSAAFSHSSEDFDKLKEMLNEFLDQASKRIDSSAPEEISCMNIDLLPLKSRL